MKDIELLAPAGDLERLKVNLLYGADAIYFGGEKYGLKNLIIEWASSIINAIKLYSSEDSDINLFGKILRNEQEEDSRLILTKLRSTISELLKYYLKSKNPLKSAKDIKKMLESKKEGMLTEEEWKGIIYYIYNTEDAQNIENRINNYLLYTIQVISMIILGTRVSTYCAILISFLFIIINIHYITN